MNDTMSETTRKSDTSPTPRAVRAKREAPRRRCAAVKRDGTPCTIFALVNDPHCFTHSEQPDTVEQRLAARARGGIAALAKRGGPIELPPAAFTSREAVRAYIERLADAVVAGKITAAQSNAVANLAGVVLRIEELALSAKIAAIEDKLASDERRGALAPRVVLTRADEQLGDEHGE